MNLDRCYKTTLSPTWSDFEQNVCTNTNRLTFESTLLD